MAGNNAAIVLTAVSQRFPSWGFIILVGVKVKSAEDLFRVSPIESICALVIELKIFFAIQNRMKAAAPMLPAALFHSTVRCRVKRF